MSLSSNSEQNGRLPAPQQAVPPTDPRLRNKNVPATSAASTITNQPTLCKNFAWGVCISGHCQYEHKHDFEFTKSIVKFCRNYQNRSGCTRPGCKFLHTSKEEQSLFMTSGQLPRVLAERYMIQSSLPLKNNPEVKNPMYEYVAQPPLPPPPPPPASLPAASVPPASLPPASLPPAAVPPVSLPPASLPSASLPLGAPLAVADPHLEATMDTLLMPPPPPPPPTTTTTPPPRVTAPIYTAPNIITQTTSGYGNQQPLPISAPIPTKFDPSRPPPPLPVIPPNRGNKRCMDIEEAGPSSKARKTDDSLDSQCEQCDVRELSIQQLDEQMDKMQREAEYQRVLLDKISEDFENGKLLLRAMVNAETFDILDTLVETKSAAAMNVPGPASPQPLPSSSSSETSTVPKQFLMHLIEAVVGSMKEPASHADNNLLQSLSLERRSSALNNSVDPLQSLFESVRGSAASGVRAAGAVAATNGLSRLSAPSGAAAPSRALAPAAAPRLALPPAAEASPPAPYLPQYPPGVAAPPARPYYPYAYPSPNAAAPPPGAPPPRPPPAPQPAQPPPPAPPMHYQYPPGRYPSPYYGYNYPPYQ